MENIEKKLTSNMSVKKATIINGAGRYVNILFSLGVNVVLSRLLTPEEYGIVAVVTIFTTFFSLFADMGFGSAYIENRELTKEDRDSLFSFMCYVGFGLFLLFFGIAYFIAWFYKSDVYIYISWLLGFNLFLTAVKAIPLSDLQKQFKFATVSIVQIISSVVSSGIAVLMAFYGCSYYSIVAQSIIYTFVNLVVFEVLTKCKFKFKLDVSVLKKTYKFATGQLGFNCINYFSRNLDNILISSILGETSLAYYDKAYKTSTYPVSNFASIIGGSIHPVLAQQQNNKLLVYDQFKKAFLFLFAIGCYASFALYLTSRETILVLYGDQWEQSIFPFSMLALSLAFQMSLNITGAFYQTLNKTHLLAIEGIISTAIIVTGIGIGVSFNSISSVAIGYLIAETVNFIQGLFVLSKFLFKRSFKDIVIHVFKLICCTLCSFIICYFTFKYLPFENIYGLFAFKISFSLIVYFVFLFIFREDKLILSVFKKKPVVTSKSKIEENKR